MFRLVKLVIVILFIANSSYAAQSKFYIKDINKFGDVINIVGGRIPTEKLNSHQIWANICFVISNPLEEDLSIAEWVGRKKYPLKETYMENFNESHLNYMLSNIIRYYIINAHSIAKKDSNENIRIVVHVHREASAKNFIKSLQSTMDDIFPELNIYTEDKDIHEAYVINQLNFPNHVTLEYKYGYLPSSLTNYDNADIILSISPVASVNQTLQPGNIVIPTQVVPMSLDSMTLITSRESKMSNHIIEVADKIISTQTDKALSIANSRHLSTNPMKKELKAGRLKREDFQSVSVIQVDGYFNPKLLPPYFYLVE